MLGVAQSLQLKHGKFMEQISEVKAFLGLNWLQVLVITLTP